MLDPSDAEVLAGVLLVLRQAVNDLSPFSPWRQSLDSIARRLDRDLGRRRAMGLVPDRD